MSETKNEDAGRRRVALTILAAASLCLALVDGLVAWPVSLVAHHPDDLVIVVVTIRVLLAALAATLLVILSMAKRSGSQWALSRAARLQMADASDKQPIWQYSGKELTTLASGSDIAEPRARAYANLIVGLCGRTAHTNESYQAGEHAMQRTVVHHFELSKSMRDEFVGATTIPFPIMTVEKGFLPDGLDVALADAKRLPIVPYETVLRLQLKTLQTLYRECMGESGDQSLFSDACHQIGRNGTLSPSLGVYQPAGALDAAFDAEFERRNPLPAQGLESPEVLAYARAKSFLQKLKDFVRTYTDAYPICVELASADMRGHVTITYSHTTRVLEANDGWRDSLRMWLGLAPYKFRVPLVLPFLARSYHLALHTDSSLYLFSQSIENSLRERWPLQKIVPDGTADPPYVRRKIWNPLSQSHLHIRGFQGRPAEAIFAFVRFDERPPGTIGLATALLGLNVVFIGMMGYLCSLGRTSSDLDIVALVVAMPGVAAILLGDRRSFANPNTSITTRMGLGATIVLSASGVLLWGAQAKGALQFPVPGVGIIGLHLPINDGAWLALLLIACVAFAHVCRKYMHRARAYRQKYFRQPRWERPDRRPDIQPTHEGMGLLVGEATTDGGGLPPVAPATGGPPGATST